MVQAHAQMAVRDEELERVRLRVIFVSNADRLRHISDAQATPLCGAHGRRRTFGELFSDYISNVLNLSVRFEDRGHLSCAPENGANELQGDEGATEERTGCS
jgi:hypothetical protein